MYGYNKLRLMSDAQQSRATLSCNFVQLSIFHRQTITKQTWLLVTQTST